MTAIHFGLLAGMLVIGVVLGWIFRGDRCAKEKIAVNASWQDQLESQQSEHERLAEQNKSLMEQISQYQASHKDSVNRAKELSDSLKETFARRDELQRQIKDIRSNLEVAVAQRDRLKSDMDSRSIQDAGSATGMREKDDKIFRLSRELTSWQSRVPPLVEKFQERDKQARELEAELDKAHARIEAFEEMARNNQTRIEPVDAETLPDGLDASNEPHSDTVASNVTELQDQIEEIDETEEVSEALTEFEEEVQAAIDDHAIVNNVSLDDDEKDDLKMIKGVGPAIEKTLNDLGICRFNQIAEMSEYDIDRVAQQLKGFRSRIYREDWIGQARELQYDKTH